MDLTKIMVRKLYRHRIIGGKHTAIENVTKGIPKHLVGQAKEILQNLIRMELIIIKPTSYGIQVSLNAEKIHEIEELIYE